MDHQMQLNQIIAEFMFHHLNMCVDPHENFKSLNAHE